MNRIKNSIFRFRLISVLSLLVSGVLVVTSCSKSGSSPSHSHLEQRVDQKEKKEIWTCTMHPQIREDHPGHCPICGMSLVKVVDDKSASEAPMPEGHASFQLSLKRQQMIGVKYGVVERKTLYKSIRAAGRLAFDPELYTAQNEYIEALKQAERVKDSSISDVRHSADRMVQSAKLRLKILGLSDHQISQMNASDITGSNLLIHKPGQDIWVYAEVNEMDLPLIRSGLVAEISAGFLGGNTLSGKVVSVDRVINPATRTAKARILLRDGKVLLRPESYVDVTIQASLGEQVIVPVDAVLDTGSQSWVFVASGEGHFEPRLVKIKLQADDSVAIASGLSGGEKIVTSANFLIDSESRLKGAMVAHEAPSCPKGQHWDVPMAMCMADGEGK